MIAPGLTDAAGKSMCVISGVLVAVGISGRFDSPVKSVAVGCGEVGGGSGGGGGLVGVPIEVTGKLQARPTIKAIPINKRARDEVLVNISAPPILVNIMFRFELLFKRDIRINGLIVYFCHIGC